MSRLDCESISKKLTGMTRRINRLSFYQSLTLEEYLENEDRQASIERYLEIVIQAALDINRMLIRSLSDTNVDNLTNVETFLFVSELGLITSELADQLIPSAQFRNVLAHVYDDISPEMVYRALKLSSTQYQQYVQQVQIYLNSLQDD